MILHERVLATTLKYLGGYGKQALSIDDLFPAPREVFQVKAKIKQRQAKSKARIQQRLRNSKRRIEHRLRQRRWQEQRRRHFPDQNIHYDYSAKVKAGRFAGLGACLLLVQRLDLADALDDNLSLLKRHVPYHDSDPMSLS